MLLQVLERFRVISESHVWLNLNHLVHQILGFSAHVVSNIVLRWPFDFFCNNIIIDLLMISSRESNTANEHLEEYTSNSPDINSWSMLIFINNFRGQIVGSTNEGIHHLLFNIRVVFLIHVLGLTKVNELDIVIIINHDVERFEITMHDFFALEVFEGIDKLSHIDPGQWLTKTATLHSSILGLVLSDLLD